MRNNPFARLFNPLIYRIFNKKKLNQRTRKEKKASPNFKKIKRHYENYFYD